MPMERGIPQECVCVCTFARLCVCKQNYPGTELNHERHNTEGGRKGKRDKCGRDGKRDSKGGRRR